MHSKTLFIYFNTFQRVYIDECNYEIPPSKFPRSNSFPDLRDLLYGSKEKDKLCNRPRRRANSEVVPTVSDFLEYEHDHHQKLWSCNLIEINILLIEEFMQKMPFDRRLLFFMKCCLQSILL